MARPTPDCRDVEEESVRQRRELYLRHRILPVGRVVGRPVFLCACADPVTRAAALAVAGEDVVLREIAPHDVVAAIEQRFSDDLVREAVLRLDREAPRFSARRLFLRPSELVASLFPLIFVVLIAVPDALGTLALGVVGLAYLANILCRLVLFCAALRDGQTGYRVAPTSLTDEMLPVYTILVPLYREANVLDQLLGAIDRLDYPPRKLDVKLILEADDEETCAAVAARSYDARFDVLRVPPCEPRTKPKACNYGLQFARGDHVVIYDAEDVPEPDQLRKAAVAFA